MITKPAGIHFEDMIYLLRQSDHGKVLDSFVRVEMGESWLRTAWEAFKDIADYFDEEYWELHHQEKSQGHCNVPAKTCRLCRETNLHWQKVDGKWRLFNKDDQLHQCPVRPLPSKEQR